MKKILFLLFSSSITCFGMQLEDKGIKRIDCKNFDVQKFKQLTNYDQVMAKRRQKAFARIKKINPSLYAKLAKAENKKKKQNDFDAVLKEFEQKDKPSRKEVVQGQIKKMRVEVRKLEREISRKKRRIRRRRIEKLSQQFYNIREEKQLKQEMRYKCEDEDRLYLVNSEADKFPWIYVKKTNKLIIGDDKKVALAMQECWDSLPTSWEDSSDDSLSID